MQYDLYAPAATVANAVIKTVQLDPNDWSVPRAAVEAAFSDKTKLILINSPHKCAAAHGPARTRRPLQRRSTCSCHTRRALRSTDAVLNELNGTRVTGPAALAWHSLGSLCRWAAAHVCLKSVSAQAARCPVLSSRARAQPDRQGLLRRGPGVHRGAVREAQRVRHLRRGVAPG